jgi:hypothetical protein
LSKEVEGQVLILSFLDLAVHILPNRGLAVDVCGSNNVGVNYECSETILELGWCLLLLVDE